MSELEQTIEELEAEVLAELEEASDAQTKGATPAEPKKKIDAVTPGGEVDDGGAAVADPEAKVETSADEDRCCRESRKLQLQFRVMHNRRALVKQTVLRSSLLVIHQKAKLLLKQNT
jgi:hypothetical protein